MRNTILSSVLLLAAFRVAAADGCSADAFDAHAAAGPTHGAIVVTLRTREGEDTRVLAGAAGDPGLSGHEGFRIASVTKTYVAATVLRLWETGRLDLDAPVTSWLRDDWRDRLQADGYVPERISVRQLLSHTAGLADHAQTPSFLADIQARRGAGWSRDRALRHLVATTDPVAAPGERYAYSDTGYVLLGALVEQVTGQPLATAVRAQLDFDRLGLRHTWWEQMEPDGPAGRVHQVFEGIDTHDWDPSMDLFGGGGLVASTADMAAFFAALLEGRVFERPQTLAAMRSVEGLPADSPYRLGLLAYDVDGVAALGHSGFWGTLVMHVPASGDTVAGGVLDRADMPRLKSLVEALTRCGAGDDASRRAGSGT
ncbi:beta-lactamase family protein [Luteimonas sp. BDR2-5]|uniref:serine hydrolase domain-containing protein n=1 Tax=Proluteimonas luteida TaxID=2878685 RepID=UPI001E3D2645|nr:serine hydrolase domain-containing protein [Luteimonas sp. BDR2-5]MCD9028811.1 beta-lactamase family protein [Luteimonas sp. BDR2-5]